MTFPFPVLFDFNSNMMLEAVRAELSLLQFSPGQPGCHRRTLGANAVEPVRNHAVRRAPKQRALFLSLELGGWTLPLRAFPSRSLVKSSF